MPMSLKAKKQVYCSTICRAWCCRNLLFFGTGKEDSDIDKFYKLRNVNYKPETKELSVPNKCNWITNHNKCRLYSWRPNACREYECEKLKSMTLDS